MAEELSYADRIFGAIGGIIDGATSVAGDYLDYKILEQEIDAQKSGQTSTPEPSYQTTAATDAYSAFSTPKAQAFMVYGALALSAVATAAALAND
tara:strand:+ start:9636 stop:9920 length:285 start_codon:yes stop_codon:yes gene_type:complete